MKYPVMTRGLVVLAGLGFWGDVCATAPLKGIRFNIVLIMTDDYDKMPWVDLLRERKR